MSAPTSIKPRQRVYRTGAWNLRGPGVYVVFEPEKVTIGHRPGAFHYLIATIFPLIALGVILTIGREIWWLGAGIGLLFGIVPVLPLLNFQRYEVSPGLLRATGRALGFQIDKRWTLAADAAVRVEHFMDWEPDDNNSRWPRFQAQLKVSQGWIAIAELLIEREPVLDFARRMAETAGVPLLDSGDEQAPPSRFVDRQ